MNPFPLWYAWGKQHILTEQILGKCGVAPRIRKKIKQTKYLEAFVAGWHINESMETPVPSDDADALMHCVTSYSWLSGLNPNMFYVVKCSSSSSSSPQGISPLSVIPFVWLRPWRLDVLLEVCWLVNVCADCPFPAIIQQVEKSCGLIDSREMCEANGDRQKDCFDMICFFF